MPVEVIRTREPFQRIAAAIRGLPAALTGRVQDPQGVGAQFRALIGWTFYGLIAKSFDDKSHGGTDEAGESWPRNTPAYLAYTKGRLTIAQKRGQPRANPRDYLMRRDLHLSGAQRKIWFRTYKEELPELMLRLPVQQARGLAATRAWAATRAEGAVTLLERYGAQEDTILVDEGNLRRTTLPGEVVETTYREGDRDQIYETPTGEIVVGSRNPLAVVHHEGRGNLPERRFWPLKFPQRWRHAIQDQAVAGIRRLVRLIENEAL